MSEPVISLDDIDYTETPLASGGAYAYTCRVCWALVGPLSTNERTNRPNLRRLHAQWHIENEHTPVG